MRLRERPSARSPRATLVVLLALSGAACGEDPAASLEATLAELEAPGPYAVGYRSMPVTYTAPLTGQPRTVEVLVWYPAEATTGDRPLYVLKASTVAVVDAPPLMTLGPRPVVIFSHGHQAYASCSSFFMEHLASHGFVVAAPMHTGNTFIDGDARQTDIYYLRAHDIRATLDAVATGRPAVIAGHSFGGYTAYALGGATYDVDTASAACAGGTGSSGFCSTLGSAEAELFRAGLAEPRFAGVLAIDAGDFPLFGARGVAAVQRPVLHMVAEDSVRDGDPYWDALTAPQRTRVVLTGGDHNDFTDSCALGLGLRCSTLPPAQAYRLLNVFGLAFARQLTGEGTEPPPLADLLTARAW
jgi:predicted dienelactone hydrolase